MFCKKKSPEAIDSQNKAIVEQMTNSERELIDKYSGLKVGKTIEIFNVPIVMNGKPEYIHTTRSGDDQKEDLVLVHGYLFALPSFYRMMADLSAHYRLWCVDLIGMGLSSRPEFTCTSTQETIDYFMDTFEQWRKQVGLERFHMAGHSFGGYMSGMYSLRYPERVKKLLLMSPAGVSHGLDMTNKDEFLASQKWVRRQIIKMAIGAWEKKLTPHTMAKKAGVLKGPLIKRWVKGGIPEGEEQKLAYTYISGIFKLPESTLKALHYILSLKGTGCLAFEDFMHELKMPVEIYYGDTDWMDADGSKRVVAKGGIKGGIHIIPKAGHRMNLDNPKFISDLLVSHKLKEDEISTAEPKEVMSEIVSVKEEMISNKFEAENNVVMVQA